MRRLLLAAGGLVNYCERLSVHEIRHLLDAERLEAIEYTRGHVFVFDPDADTSDKPVNARAVDALDDVYAFNRWEVRGNVGIFPVEDFDPSALRDIEEADEALRYRTDRARALAPIGQRYRGRVRA